MENSNDLNLTLERAKDMAIAFKRPYVCPDLLLDSLLFCDNSCIRSIFNSFGLSDASLKIISQTILIRKKESKAPKSRFSPKVREYISFMQELSEGMDQEDNRPETLLLAMCLSETKPELLLFLEENGLDLKEMSIRISGFLKDNFSAKVNFLETYQKYEEENKESGEDDSYQEMFEANRIIEEFATNLNIQALNGDFDNLIDFDNKADEMTAFLCRQKKPNIILVGREGVGKTTCVELLAKKIVDGEVPQELEDKVIYSVDLSKMVAGTQYRGMFEERLTSFIEEVKEYKNVILFFDEIHTLVGAGSTGREGDLEASNILKPALARGEISCIGATTTKEYNLKIKKDAAFSRRFNKIIVTEPSKQTVKHILKDLSEFYENSHGVVYSKQFLDNILDYCDKFMPNKVYPDKLVDTLDHCAALTKIRYSDTPDDIKKMQREFIKLNSSLKEGDENADLNNIYLKIEEIKEKTDAWHEELSKIQKRVTLSDLEKFFEKYKTLFRREINYEDLSVKLEKFKANITAFSDKTRDIKEPSSYLIHGGKLSGKSEFCRALADFSNENKVAVIKFSAMTFDAKLLCEKVIDNDSSLIIIEDVKNLSNDNAKFLAKIMKEKIFEKLDGEKVDFGNVDFILTCDSKKGRGLGFSKSDLAPEPDLMDDLKSEIDYEIYFEEIS